MKPKVSPLQAARTAYEPKLPKVLALNPSKVAVRMGRLSHPPGEEAIRKLFPQTYGQPEVSFVPGKAPRSFHKPLKVALVLSGGQAPGGHNVVAGLFDGLKKLNRKNTLIGYLGGLPGSWKTGKWKLPKSC